MIVRGALGIVAVLTLTACSAGDEPSAGGESPTSTTSSTPEMPVDPSGVPTAAPTTPTPAPPSLPAAKDGENYTACADGNCEVVIRKAASITLDGKKVAVTVVDEAIKLKGPSFEISVRGSGVSSWGSMDGPTHSASVKAADGTTAILVLRSRS